ncbi:DUF899 domain-containing protein [Kribbella sp. NBC_00382]|uniref:DUF899 family protein n=1 Tax=Kribbella sp. NBC_00382 TaxID=2975967 RepID=UPI0030E18518
MTNLPTAVDRETFDAELASIRASMHLICYVRDGDRVFETYWTTLRGVEAMDYSYALMDLTVYGRREQWEDSPAGWPKEWQPGKPKILNGRPIAQWSRIEAGRSDAL